VELHTRLWDPDKKATFMMRAKFEGPCVPDPKVPAIELTPEYVQSLRSRLPEMPAVRAERFMSQYGFSNEEAVFLSSDPEVANYFEALTADDVTPRTAMHWLTTQLMPAVKERGQELGTTPVTPPRLTELLHLLAKEMINAKAAREVLMHLFDSEQSAEEIVAAKGFTQVSDATELETMIDKVMNDNPDAVDKIRKGQKKALGFLMGQVMQASKGKANPKVAQELFNKKLGTN
jgi:aspartyl-tRNA(Asn)/glutamyl-tRNA(Gln) amidotransferase subunit B